MVINVVALVEGRERQGFEGGKRGRGFAQHAAPPDVIVAVVIEYGRARELYPRHRAENDREGDGYLWKGAREGPPEKAYGWIARGRSRGGCRPGDDFGSARCLRRPDFDGGVARRIACVK